jgi:hypothetical protein
MALPIVATPDCLRPTFTAESLDAIRRALQARLATVEDEILRLVKVASETDDPKLQQTYLDLAQDLQRDARETRNQVSQDLDRQEEP